MGAGPVLLLLSAAQALAATIALAPAPIPPLGGRDTFTIGPGQSRRHLIALEPGQFLQATVHQREIDLVLRLLGPEGAVLEQRFDSSEGPVGMEPASLMATVGGWYTVEVHAPADVEVPGRYDLESQPPRRPDERDRMRREAERLMQVGGRHMGPRAAGVRRNRPGPDGPTAGVAYRNVLPLWEALGETCWEAEARSGFAIVQTWSADATDIDNYIRSLDLWQACGADGYKFIETVLFTGRSQLRWSRLREAAETLELGLALARVENWVLTTHFLVALSSVYGQLGETTRAIEVGEEGLAHVRAWPHPQGTAVVLTNLANAHYRRGSLQKARDLAQEALVLRREIKEELGLIAGLTTLADISQGLGEPDLALGYLDEAVAVSRQFGPGTEFFATVAAARALRAMDRPADARARLQRALESAPAKGEPRAELRARLALAGLALDEGDAPGARPHVERTLEAEGTIGDPLLRADALDLRARVSLAEHELPAAQAAVAQALAIRRTVGDRAGEAGTLFLDARVARASGDLEETRRRLEAARDVVAAQRAEFVSPQLRATWASTVREVEEAYVSVLMELHARAPERGLDALAFEASEAASARSLLDVLGDQEERAPGSSAEREFAARERLTGALDREMRARAASAPAEELRALAQEVRNFSAEHERLWAELRAGDAGRRVRPQPVRLSDVRERVLDDGDTLLEFFLGPEGGYAWVVTRDRLHSYSLPPRARVDAAVDAVKRTLAVPPAPSGAPDRAAAALAALAAMILPQDRSALAGGRLVVVADGSLHHVPFAALPDAGGQPLVARFEIANVPSASVAAQLRRDLAGRATAPRAIAAFADPVYGVGDIRLSVGTPRAAADATLERATRAFGFKDGRLPRLPFTRREAQAIAALAPTSSKVDVDFAANLDAALSPDLASYRYVHFATHGLLNDARPELSGLVLSLVDREGRARRGLLTAPDVSNLRLGAELVVLSSCRSAAGREVRGEGLLGLTRAFMHAGAPRVVASLWPVDDLASAQLMTGMYEGMLGPQKLAPAAALRHAQLGLLRHRRWRAPYYWAAFQIQGEWR
jgi:CHAT domain-containing protein/tetratricopeptide (TPR) repeat protein